MSRIRGFGTTYSFPDGRFRSWYIGRDGVKRWVATDVPCDVTPNPAGAERTAEALDERKGEKA